MTTDGRQKFGGGSNQARAIAIAAKTYALDRLPGLHAHEWGYHSDNGQIWQEGDAIEGYGSFRLGETVGCSVDIASGIRLFTREGVRNEGFDLKGIKGRLYPVVLFRGYTPDSLEIETNFTGKERPFKYVPGVAR
ncbi:hypothetical protein EDB81DRAFT_862201 [Dactylonectria macrodidyma]|uniref:B30.2/SPRY domain-containing protein n=1 Tax=Dactylonectria macrodidyma TaxID=307937 RepID=A0A9P9DAA9_9HYPO|nr:hypothetical protein EDB81DRAFT_862201 [Dactylonectria macrodidyma]